MKIMRLLLLLLVATSLQAQIPGRLPWWERPLAKELGLSEEQDGKIRNIVKEFRPKLIQLRGQIEGAEADLRDEMNEPQVDVRKATAAIEKVVEVRGALTRELSQMGLRMRLVLTVSQWQELQKRQPLPDAAAPIPQRDGRRPAPRGGADTFPPPN